MFHILRTRAGPAIIILGTSTLGGAIYRSTRPSSSTEGSLNPQTFTPYTLIDKRAVSATSAIFTLRNRDGGADPEALKEGLGEGEGKDRCVWSVQVKQPQLQIARAYTPLPPPSPLKTTSSATSDNENTTAPTDIRLLIRHETSGEVSTYLHRLPIQSTIELRGPNTEVALPQDIKEVIFLAGGTGIAPAMQVARVLGRRTGSRMHILWANRTREDCVGGVGDAGGANTIVRSRMGWWRSLLGAGQPPGEEALVDDYTSHGKGVLVQELDALKERSRVQTKGLKIDYYVDEENTFIKPGDVARQLRLDSSDVKGSKVILVSGPDGFIEYWAGKKLWVGGREVQGPLGGVLSKMDLQGWTVCKL